MNDERAIGDLEAIAREQCGFLAMKATLLSGDHDAGELYFEPQMATLRHDEDGVWTLNIDGQVWIIRDGDLQRALKEAG